MRNINIIKKIFILIIYLLLTTYNYAAVVSDNDGSAFITKAEFDSLKNNFQSQIDQYNTSIDSKIDSAISQYLAGIKTEKTEIVKTGFVLDGDESAIIFVGKANDYNSMNNTLKSRDTITNFFAGTFATNAYYIQDSYDTFVFDASHEKGDTNSFVFVLDKNNRVTTSKKNVLLNITRVYTCYSTLRNQKGMVWKDITQTLDLPSALSNTSTAYIDETQARGWGFQNFTQTETGSTLYPLGPLQNRRFSSNNNPTTGDSGISTTNYVVAWYNDEIKTLVDIIKSCDVSITGTDTKPNMHWPNGSNYNIKSFDSDHEWGKITAVKKYSDTRIDYTYTYKNRAASGWCSSQGESFTPAVSGYGGDLATVNKSFSNVYYDETSSEWKKNISYAGGLPICTTKKAGHIDLSFKADDSVTIAFTNAQNTTFPTSGATRLKKGKYKLSTASDWTDFSSSVDLTADSTYDFKIDLLANDELYLTANMSSSSESVTFTQVGDAKLTTED